MKFNKRFMLLTFIIVAFLFFMGCSMDEFFNIFSPNLDTPPPTISITNTPIPAPTSTPTPTPSPMPTPTPYTTCGGGCGGGTCPYSY